MTSVVLIACIVILGGLLVPVVFTHKARLAVSRFMIRIATTLRSFDGFELWTRGPQDHDRLEEALELLREADPRRYRRLARTTNIIVATNIGPCHYRPDLGICIYVEEGDSVEIASLLVHEATHALLRKKGIVSATPELRRREEALCLREQLRFHITYHEQRGADRDTLNEVTAWADSTFERLMSSEWWTHDNVMARVRADLRNVL